MTMKIILASNAVRALLAVAAASALSACAPNPQVMPDAVYNRYPQPHVVQPPRVNRPAPAQRPVTPPPLRRLPLPQEQAPVVVAPAPMPEVITLEALQPPETPELPETQVALPPKKYVSSPAARGLRQQAQTEAGQGNVSGAVATIERALRIEPENPELWLTLSELNKQQGNAQQAASMAAKAQYYQESLH